jgi:hypothetical protein
MKLLIPKRLFCLQVSGLILLLFLGRGAMFTLPAMAEVSQREEAPGQMLYQSQQTLRDQAGNRWEAIAFSRVYPNGTSIFYLRLVGAPNVADLARDQPLTVITASGQTLKARNTSSEIFTNASPAPHVRQYDLQPLLLRLEPNQPLRLVLPTAKGSTIELAVPPSVIQEWQQVASCGGFVCDPGE